MTNKNLPDFPILRNPTLNAIGRIAVCAAAMAGGTCIGVVYLASGPHLIIRCLVSGAMIGLGLELAAVTYRLVRS